MTDSLRTPDAPSERETNIALTRVSEVIERALKGQLTRDRDPLASEPKILTPLHINMIMDRAGGYQLKEIAERWEYTELQVANVLGSPDAQTILSTIFAMQAGALISMEARFKALAPAALNVQVELLYDPAAPASVRNKVASEILDRAGYAPKQRTESLHEHKFFIPTHVATGMAAALQESQRVASVDYSQFVQSSNAEVAASHLRLGTGHPEDEDGASPVPASGDPMQEKVA